MSKQFALFGHPLTHTLSPRIYRAFARDLGIDMSYRTIDTPAEGFKAALEGFAGAGGAGGNVTLPLKEAAYGLCSDLSPAARRAQSVNTLIRTDHGWHGDNTDGAGLVRDLSDRHRLDLRGRRTLLLGAGGAARGVAPALLDAGIDKLVVVNRTAERADQLVDLLDAPGRVGSRYWDDLGALGDFELIINATSAARGGGALQLPFGLASPRFVAVDLNYGEAAGPFLSWARAARSRPEAVIDGLGMLVEQAAEAFERWHGKRPDCDGLFAELRAEHALLQSGD